MSEDQSGSGNSVHVLVVDEEGEPVTGQDVAAHFSCAREPNTVRHQYTDVQGHTEFFREDADEPLHVEILVRDQSFGPYTVENAAAYTIEITRK